MELLLVRHLPIDHEALRPVLRILVESGVGCLIARRPDGIVVGMTAGPHEVAHVDDEMFAVWMADHLIETTNAVGAAAYLLADHYRKD
jgi:hypothetical protein